ncbi:hypothetical protein AMK19_20385 [Kitasatospora sp. CB01950]|nr:hypothetical protein AMK19_20385 [Kitasatospora sp. CB01950]
MAGPGSTTDGGPTDGGPADGGPADGGPAADGPAADGPGCDASPSGSVVGAGAGVSTERSASGPFACLRTCELRTGGSPGFTFDRAPRLD